MADREYINVMGVSVAQDSMSSIEVITAKFTYVLLLIFKIIWGLSAIFFVVEYFDLGIPRILSAGEPSPFILFLSLFFSIMYLWADASIRDNKYAVRVTLDSGRALTSRQISLDLALAYKNKLQKTFELGETGSTFEHEGTVYRSNDIIMVRTYESIPERCFLETLVYGVAFSIVLFMVVQDGMSASALLFIPIFFVPAAWAAINTLNGANQLEVISSSGKGVVTSKVSRISEDSSSIRDFIYSSVAVRS
jgi:hypothetical protein